MPAVAECADPPLAVEAFKVTPGQQRQFDEMARLKAEYDRAAAPYDREINAWFAEAAKQFQKANAPNSGSDWRLERKALLKELADIQSRKDPLIDQLEQQVDSAMRDVLKTVPRPGK
jgi:hypothetical protein